MYPWVNAMDTSNFYAFANATLMHLHDQLESFYESEEIDELELEGNILTIIAEDGQALVVNLHEASRQMWLASPISGGSHFDCDDDCREWVDAEGNDLKEILRKDIQIIFGIDVYF